MLISENKFDLNLRKSLDSVYQDFCFKLAENPELAKKTRCDLVQYKIQTSALENEIGKLKANIKSCKQFNQKVELNPKLKSKEEKLSFFNDSY